MKLTSIGLMAGGLISLPGPSWLPIRSRQARQPIGEPGFQSQGLLPETPQQSTALAPGTLRQQASVEPNVPAKFNWRNSSAEHWRLSQSSRFA